MRLFITLIILCVTLVVIPEENHALEDELVHLSTLWDAPGYIGEISASGEYVVIERGDIKRLVHIHSGNVVLEINNGVIAFDSSGQYVLTSHYASEPPYTVQNPTITNLETFDTYTLGDNYNAIEVYESFLITVQWEDNFFDASSEIRDLATGEIVSQQRGNFCRFSRDLSKIVVYYMEDNRVYANVIDTMSGNILASFSSDRVYSFSCAFNADDSLLALYFLHDDMQIIDTSTWEILYNLTGSIQFSPDGNYIAHNNHAGYSDVQFLDADTGEVIDEFLGSISFSRDGQYWIRAEAVDYDLRDAQIIDLTSNEVIFQRVGYGVPTIDANGLVSVWDFSTQSAHYYDADTGEFIREIPGEVRRFDNFIVARDTFTPFTYLRNWETNHDYAIGRQIERAFGSDTFLVSNGLYVDVYGVKNADTVDMPPPRSSEGIALSNPGEIMLYTEINEDNPRTITEGNMLNGTYYDVLGQSSDSQWLFVSFHITGRNPELVQGWIPNENLEVIVDWQNVPILESDDPLQTLESIAFEG